MELHVATLSFSWMFGRTCSFHGVKINWFSDNQAIYDTKLHDFRLD